METIKANSAENYESILVYLSREKTPVAFKNKLDELMECGAFDNEEDATKWIETNPFEVELYYEKGYGLFAVESEAVDGLSDIHSPYSGAELVYDDLCD